MLGKIKKHWLSIFIILSIVVSITCLYLASASFESEYQYKIFRAIGWSIIPSIILYFVLSSMRKRLKKEKDEFWFFCFFSAFLLYSIYQPIKFPRAEMEKLQKGKEELAQIAQKYLNRESDNMNLEDSYSSQKYGDLAPALNLIKEGLKLSDGEGPFPALMQAFQEANLEHALSPDLMCQPEHLQKTHEKLSILSQKLQVCEKEWRKQISEIDGYADSFSLSIKQPEERTLYLMGYNEGKKKMQSLIEDYLRLWHMSIAECTSLFTFLSEISGSYYSFGDAIIFENEKNSEVYIRYLRNLKKIEEDKVLVLKMITDEQMDALQYMMESKKTSPQ
jgi:hypothetical protein